MAGSEYYDHTTFPSQGAVGSSAAMRSELENVESGFGKLPALAGNGSKVVAVNSAGTALEAIRVTQAQMKIKTVVALADAAATLTAAQMVDSGIFTITPTVARILTTDTAANIVAAIPDYQVGTWFDFTIVNTAAFDVTLAAGTGITLSGSNVIHKESATWKARIDSATAITIYNTAAMSSAPGVAAFLATPSSANLIAAVTDEAGTGALVFASSIQAQTHTAFTTGGTATAYTLTPSPALAALAAGQRFRVKFNAASGAAPTLAISGLAAKALKSYNTAGVKVDPVVGALALDMLADVEYDGTDYVVFDALKTTATTALPTAIATVAADALTLGMTAKPLDFRSATLASGAVTTLLATPVNIVVPSGATLGTVNAVKNRLVVGVMNVAGVAELFVMNAILGNYLDESQLITTTVLDAASDSAEVPYSATARTAMPFRILGYVESTQATAGVWATAPTLIQPFGAGAEIVQQVSFRAHQTTAQAIAATTYTKVLFQTENYDIGGKFADSRFTATEPGLYAFSTAVLSAAQADGQTSEAHFYLNGAGHSRVYQGAVGSATNALATGCAFIRMVPTDYVEVFVYYSVAEDTLAGTSLTHFAGHRIG